MIDSVDEQCRSRFRSFYDCEGRLSQRRASVRRVVALTIGTMLFAPRTARADGVSPPEESAPAEETPTRETGEGAPDAARRGGFLPLTLAPATDFTSGAFMAGYDGARSAAIYQAAVDAHLIGKFAMRAGYTSHDLSGRASALLGARWQALTQADHGLDAGIGLFYLPQDIRGEGQIMGNLSFGRRLGGVDVLANVAYGQDPEGDDHTVQAGLAAIYRWLPAFFVGIDGRVRGLAFSSDDKRNGLVEPAFDVTAGPIAHYVLGMFVLTGQVGVSAIAWEGPVGSSQERTDFRFGALGMLGTGLAL